MGIISIIQMIELILLIFRILQIHKEKLHHPIKNNGQRFEEMIHRRANLESSYK